MSYLNQLYLEKQKQLEGPVDANKHNNGVQARFVANKLVNKYLKDFNENDLQLNPIRLNLLVQLVDMLYRNQNNSRNLFCDDYIITKNGLAILQLLYGYVYLTEDKKTARACFLNYETDFHMKYKSHIHKDFNDKIDMLVKKVLTGTRFIETNRLKMMLNINNIQQTRLNCLEFENYKLPQEVVSELFMNFNC